MIQIVKQATAPSRDMMRSNSGRRMAIPTNSNVKPTRAQIMAIPRQKPEMPLRDSALAIAVVSRPKAISTVSVTGLRRRSQQLLRD